MGKSKLIEKQRIREHTSKIKKNISKEEVKDSDKLINIIEDSEITCSICYSSMDDKGIIFNCQHKFCFQCIQKWSKQNLTCPQCRADFTKVQRIWKEGQSAKQKTYTFKKPKQSNDAIINIQLMQSLSQLLFLLMFMDSESQMD